MATDNKKTEKPQYRYIDTDIDRDILMANLKHNAQKYVQHKGWDESRASEFYSALNNFEKAIEENRLSSDQSGSILDSAGTLNDGSSNWRDKDGKIISEIEYLALPDKKRKDYSQDFYANKEVARYIDTVAKTVYGKHLEALKNKKETPIKKFNYSKNNLFKSFLNNLAPSGNGDVLAYLDLDPYNESSKSRQTTNRANILKEYIDRHREEVSNLDWSDYSEGEKERYLANLSKLQAELNNGVTDVDYRLLNQLGSDGNAYRAFFTKDKIYDAKAELSAYMPAENNTGTAGTQTSTSNPTDGNTSQTDGSQNQTSPTTVQTPTTATSGTENTEETTNKENTVTIDPEQAKRIQALKLSFVKNFNDSNFLAYTAKPTDGIAYNDKGRPSERINSFIDNLNAKGIDFSVENLQKTRGNDIYKYMGQFYKLNPAAFKQAAKGGFYDGWVYMPESLDKKTMTVLGYNPSTRKTGRLSYKNLSEETYGDYMNILKQIDDYNQQQVQKHAEGGQVKEQGGITLSEFSKRQQKRKEETLNDPKRRRINNSDGYNNTSGFSNVDYIRLGSIAADVAALIDPEPISATVLGVGSDVANLYSDLKEGYGVGESIMNFGANAGLSLLGAIPIIGDAAGSGSKIIKGLMKFAPKINTVIKGAATTGLIANTPEIIKSLSKIGKDGVENEMNVQDWRNIATALQFILGTTKAIKTKKAQQRVQAAGKTNNVDVRVRDTQTGNTKVLRFANENDVKAIREAKSPHEVNAVIQAHPSYKNTEVLSVDKKGIKFGGEQSNWYNPFSWWHKQTTPTIKKGSIFDSVDYGAMRNYTSGKSKWSIDHYFRVGNTNPETVGNPTESFFKKGGKFQEGERFNIFSFLDKNGEKPSWYEFKKKDISEVNVPLALPNPYATVKTGLPSNANYGLGYKSDLDYTNLEYGIDGLVNISGIKNANSLKRDKALNPNHGASGYDYDNAQYNTNKARESWQSNPDNRVNDMKAFAAQYLKEHPNATQEEFLAAYNKGIDSMYSYKHEMGSDFQGNKSYRYDDKVSKFNQTNKAYYPSANSENGVHGYSIPQEKFNGTTTAQRFIDITPDIVKGIDWKFNENDSAQLRELLNGLIKDSTGRYYVPNPNPFNPEKPKIEFPKVNVGSMITGSPGGIVHPSGDPNKSQKNSSKINFGEIFNNALPNALRISRYLNTLKHNDRILDLAKSLPVNLYDPTEANRWIIGDEQAVMSGRKAAGELNDLASTPTTSDGANYTAAQMEANIKGRNYITSGEKLDSDMKTQTREQSWQQERINQQSRYGISVKNRDNLFSKATNVIKAKAEQEAANNAALQTLLGEYQQEATLRNEELKSVRETALQQSLQNKVASSMSSYGIYATAEDQELFDSVMSGNIQYSKLSKENQERFNQLSAKVKEAAVREYYKTKGIDIEPYSPSTNGVFSLDYYEAPVTPNSTTTSSKENGGKVPSNLSTPTALKEIYDIVYPKRSLLKKGGKFSDEAVIIQEMRGKIKQMELFQKSMNNQIKNLQKTLDRSQKSFDGYINQQTRK